MRRKAKPGEPLWLVEQAWIQVERAQRDEDRARAISALRHAVALAIKHAGDVTADHLDHLERLERAALANYAGAKDQHVRRAVRALASLRSVVQARLEAAKVRPIEQVKMRLVGYEGEHLSTWESPGNQVFNHYGIPEEYRAGGYRIKVQLGFGTELPDVRIYQGRKLVWRRPGAQGSPLPKRATGLEDWLGTGPGNGHGFKLTDD